METPKAPGTIRELWASDAVAALLRALEIPFVALNPGASFRRLHDSLVNYLGNERPQMLLCLHEESAVAIAHGFLRTVEVLATMDATEENWREVARTSKSAQYWGFAV